jgi:hypothetical protein
LKAGKLPPHPDNKKYLIAKTQYTPSNGWFGGKWYVDLLKKGVTEKFLDITLEAYAKQSEIAGEFGKRVPGIFTDEPHPAGSVSGFGLGGSGITWNDEIPAAFEKRFGYSLIDNLPSLAKPMGEWKKVRHNYQQIILDLFVENWAKPYFERSEKYNLQLTGHYWEHGWPNTSHGPDNMAMYAWHQRPAIDLLMNTYNGDSPNAQFGNVRSVKELASVANQMGHSRTLSENYGAGGWDLRFEDMKRLGDWSYVLGVNTNNEHISYVTIRGARKRDHPQSFSYHAPWFEGYHVLEDYFTRLSYALSQGRQINRVVVIEPTTTAWMYQGDPKLNEIGKSFTDFVNALENAQVEYDLASEDILKRHSKVNVSGAGLPRLEIGKASYDLVILPPNTENLNGKTAELLNEYSQLGGKLLCIGDFPTRKDGDKSKYSFPSMVRVSAEDAVFTAKDRTKQSGLTFSTEPGVKNVFHHRRSLDGGDIFFLCNSNQDKEITVNLDPPTLLEQWDLLTGNCIAEKRISSVVLPPSGSVVYFLRERTADETDEQRAAMAVKYSFLNPVNPEVSRAGMITAATLPALSETKIRRLDDNVLTLDYVDVKVGDEEKKDVYTWAANRFIFQKHGLPAGNPWDSQVQFRDELITKKFPAGSDFEATYHFTIAKEPEVKGTPVTSGLSIVIERPDLYKIYCNDTEVKPIPGEWYLDKAFGKIDLSNVAKPGENTVKIVASPMTIEHELEPAYLLGDFSVVGDDKGFVIAPPKPLTLSSETRIPLITHSHELEQVAWLSSGIGFRPGRIADDRSPSLTFTFDKPQPIKVIRIWNYNERNLQSRGAKSIEITSGADFSHQVKFPLVTSGLPTDVTLDKTVSEVSFKILSNLKGTTYPVAEGITPPDNGFVGLAEVQFLVADGDKLVPIKNVTVKASSELVVDSHNRKAQYLTDGSGLYDANEANKGWNRQGLPFYAGKVEYSQTFKIEKLDPAKRYTVKLNDWYGATAQVVVNSKPVEFVISAPYWVDVTDFVKQGDNEISVIVYGTPKNLLGPHHTGKLRGSAWPGNFHHAPEHQPSGAAYDTIGYGLFEDFTLFER